MNTGMPQQRPSYLSPSMTSLLVDLIQNSRSRNQRYTAETNARTVGLQRFAQQCQNDVAILMQRGDQQGAARLMLIQKAISDLANTTALLNALSSQEQELDMTVQRVLMGLPPVLTVQAQPGQPMSQQPMQSQMPQQPQQPMAQMQGKELLQAIQGAEPMPLVGAGGIPQGSGLAPQTVTQVPNAPQSQMPAPGTSVLVSQTPNPTPAPAPAPSAANGTAPAPGTAS